MRYVDFKQELQTKCESLTKNSTIDLYINLESILSVLYSSNTIEEYVKASRDNKFYSLVANVVNLAAHYRAVLSGNRHRNRVILFVQYPFDAKPHNGDLYARYRDDSIARKSITNIKHVNLTSLLIEMLPISKTILEYIDDVHLIYSNGMECSVIPYMIDSMGSRGNIRLLLTDDLYDSQYVHHGFDLLYVNNRKRTKTYINRHNVYDIIKKKANVYNDVKPSIHHIPLILSCIGDNRRNIPKVNGIGVSTLMKELVYAMDRKDIAESTSDINTLINLIPEERRGEIIRNFNMIDVETQANRYFNMYKMDIEAQMVNKFDNIALREIADKHFIEFPLMIYEMNNYKPKRSIFK